MSNRKFTLIEGIVVIAILAILAGMLLPIILEKPLMFAMLSRRSDLNQFRKRYPSIVISKEMEKSIVDGGSKSPLDDEAWKEFSEVAGGKMDLYSTVHLKRCVPSLFAGTKVEQESSGDTYERWKAFTGNPKGWTRQEFDALAEKDQVVELRFANWASITGNPKGFTEEQFNALKAKGLVSFPSKDKKPEFNPGGF